MIVVGQKWHVKYSIPFVHYKYKPAARFLKYHRQMIPYSAVNPNVQIRVRRRKILVDSILNPVDILLIPAATSWNFTEININNLMLVQVPVIIGMSGNRKAVKLNIPDNNPHGYIPLFHETQTHRS